MQSGEHEKDLSGRSFELRVADAYRTLGYHVVHNRDVQGTQTDLVCKLVTPGGPLITLGVECKDYSDPVGIALVRAFISTIVTLRSAHAVSSGALVSSSGFTASAVQASEAHPYIELLSWEDLTAEALDVRPFVKELIRRYESEPIFRGYLPLNAGILSWGGLMGQPTTTDTLGNVVTDWIARGRDTDAPNVLFVLGDFGCGKTTLLERIGYEQARRYFEGEDLRLPLYVALRNYRDTLSVPELLRASFRDMYVRDVPADLLWRRMQDGMFYVLLDGFDEMADRSDASRRLELFLALSALFRSRSSTVMTSRPSYFVERGELNDLLASLRVEEASLLGPKPYSYAGSSPSADALRRKLVALNREVAIPERALTPMSTQDVRAIQVLALDEEQIKAYLELWAMELSEAGATTNSVYDFIERTYDLSDLASRPLLLKLIVDSVIYGGIDPSDTHTQYGPSGLYEIYTDSKLDLDFDKGRNRRGGLSRDARRVLAQAVALEMYRSGVLETNVSEAIIKLLDDPSTDFDANGLTTAEIITDFSTCSFVTLDNEGRCRFIHKSFGGYFVARYLRHALDDQIISEWIDREVLYFLGGFAPTMPRLKERLWTRYLTSDAGDVTLRRNLAVAFLHTGPSHEGRKFEGTEIADASFGSLTFLRPRHTMVEWRNCEVGKLRLDGGILEDVIFDDVKVEKLAADACKLDIAFEKSVIAELAAVGVSGDIAVRSGAIGRLHLDESSVSIEDVTGGCERVEVRNSSVRYARTTQARSGELSAVESRLTVAGGGEMKLSVRDCTFVLEPECRGGKRWSLERCAVRTESESWALGDADASTIVFSDATIPYAAIAKLPCGLFGRAPELRLETLHRMTSKAWGVLFVDDESELAERTAFEPVRYGNLLLAGEEWYQEALVSNGVLSEAWALQRMCSKGWEGGRLVARTKLHELLRRVHKQHGELAYMTFRTFAELFPSHLEVPESLASELGGMARRSR